MIYNDNSLYSGSQLQNILLIEIELLHNTSYHFHAEFLGHINMNK